MGIKYKISLFLSFLAILACPAYGAITSTLEAVKPVPSIEAIAIKNSGQYIKALAAGENLLNITLNKKFLFDLNPSVSLNSIDKKTYISPTYIRWSRKNELEILFIIGKDIPDGYYYLDIDRAVVPLKLDTTPPLLSITAPTDNFITDNTSIILSGSCETKILMINKKKIYMDKENKFTTAVSLNPGQNTIEAVATDEAGNASTVFKSIFYNYKPPILFPINQNRWFKSGSTITATINIADLQDDIFDETEGIVYYGRSRIDSSLIYDKQTNRLSGFIILPNNMSNGKNDLIVQIMDNGGYTGTCNLPVYIDRYPPTLKMAKNEIKTNTKNRIVIPLYDAGSGVDSVNSIVTVTKGSITLEGVIISDKTSDTIIFEPKYPLDDGKYLVGILSKDKAGNIGSKLKIVLTIDSTASISTSDILSITDFYCCPNPFNPAKGENIKLSYTLSKPSTAKFYIYNIVGELIWKNESPGTPGYNNSVSWDGKNSFGETVSNGVYPIYLIADDGTGNVIKTSSKIVISK